MNIWFDAEADSHGSPQAGELFFLAVGQIRKPHGVHGEVQMTVLTDFPERLTPGRIVYLGERHLPVTINSRREHRDVLLLTFKEYPDRSSVEVLRNQTLFIPVDEAPELPEGEYFHHQILGLRAVTEAGQQLGEVVDILETGANDVCVVLDAQEREILLPIIDDVIIDVDLETGSLVIRLLPGLLPE
jgi:16S rRNA processing protein RimM